MANTAVADAPVPVNIVSSGGVRIVPVRVSFDTPAADLTIFTPAADKRWGIFGLQFIEATAANLTVKSGANTLVTYEFAANSGISKDLTGWPLLVGSAVGEILAMQCSAAIGSMIVYVGEFSQLRLS